MTAQTDWIESFTGLKADNGAAIPGGDPADRAAEYELKKSQQRVLLAVVREKLATFKQQFQEAMSQTIESGKLKGQQLLKESGTQVDEVEAYELSMTDLAVSDESKTQIAKGAALVTQLSFKLSDATYAWDGEVKPLFDNDELREEFWTPLMRERILPESYIPAEFSATQKQLDEVSALYLERVEEEKALGTLTPELDRRKEIMNSACELLTLAGDMAGTFGGGTPDAKLAVSLLNTAAAVVKQSGEVYDQVKAGKYGDASASAFEVMGTIASSAMKGFGVDEKVTDAVSKSISAGGKAIQAGCAFARGSEGAEDGLTLMASVVQGALEAAIGVTGDAKTKQALEIAKSTVPALFKQAALGAKLPQLIYDKDYAGMVGCLGKSFSIALASVQELRAIAQGEGRSKDEKEAINKRIEAQQKEIEQYGEMGLAGVTMLINAALAAKRGEYMAMLNGVIDSVGGQLATVLTDAGLDEKEAKTIAGFYVAASSAPKALQCLTKPECDVPGCLSQLSAGILVAFKQAAPGNATLQTVGGSLAASLMVAGAGLKVRKSYKDKDYGEAVTELIAGLKDGLGDAFKLSGLDSGDDGESSDKTDGGDSGDKDGSDKDGSDKDGGKDKDKSLSEQANELLDSLTETAKALAEGDKEPPSPKALLADLKRAAAMVKKGGKLAANLDEARLKLEAEQKKAALAAIHAEAEDALAEAQADADELSEAQRFGAEASSIDKLVAKLERDRMILDMAVNIAQGGAAFLAKFVPVLGAVAAGIKLAAQMHAAGLRAQQLHRWLQNQDDLEAAQSALSSSAQNFVRNQAEQLAHYAAQAVFAAAQLAAECVKLSGMAAPVGLALDAAATAGAKLEEIARKHYGQEQLEKAWATTVQALRNPANRKLGLKAQQLNPSLAKYAMGWGAKQLGDPLARNALRACDLTDASFEDKDTDVHKVVKYLETFYRDDPKLYRELDAAPDWIPADLSLTLESWTRLKRKSVAEGQLLTIESGAIDGALAELDRLADGPGWDTLKEEKAAAALLAKATQSMTGGSTGTDGPKDGKPVAVDPAPVLRALDALEAEVRVKQRLLAQVKSGFAAIVPATATELDAESAEAAKKAMATALKVLANHARITAGAADAEMQMVAVQRQLVAV